MFDPLQLTVLTLLYSNWLYQIPITVTVLSVFKITVEGRVAYIKSEGRRRLQSIPLHSLIWQSAMLRVKAF